MARELTTVQELEHEVDAAERRAQVLGIGLAVLIALGCSDLSSKIAEGAPRWLFVAFFALSFVAGFVVARVWVEGHAGQRRIGLAASLHPTIREAALAVTTNADIVAARNNYDNVRRWMAWAIRPLVGAAACYLAAVTWWATSG